MAGTKRSVNGLEAYGETTGKKPRKTREVYLNPSYSATGAHESQQLKQAWRERTPLVTASGCEVIMKPFQCCVLPCFVVEERREGKGESESGYVERLKSELLRLKFHEKNNDLYQFRQSNDLQEYESPCITQFRYSFPPPPLPPPRSSTSSSSFSTTTSSLSVITSSTHSSLLHEQCLPWLREMTGAPLNGTVDMTCSKYEHTDVLLCHDDELEERRIAFIYYLVPSWSGEDGGTLDLFDTDEFGQPGSISRSIVPVWNSFVFFEVCPQSFHQVSEVLSSHKTRLSISGWFHGTPVPRPHPYKEVISPAALPKPLPLENLIKWVNPIYLDVGVQEQVHEQFENESQIELPDFLLDERYSTVCDELAQVHSWQVMGPPNMRHLHTADNGDLPPAVKELQELCSSEPFCILLSHLTGLDLVEGVIRPELDPQQNGNEDNATSTTPSSSSSSSVKSLPQSGEGTSSSSLQQGPGLCQTSIHRWQHGDYTLASDGAASEFTLDTVLYLACDDWSCDYGGYTSYIARDEDEELLTIQPQRNSLALVYHDRETLCFTKYINQRAAYGGGGRGPLHFYTCSSVYREINTEQQ